uniref:Uncharacterized protein n=1 Tax=Mycena chlorophos TaxID=658473 RepID=A0ABQ0KYT8_MYCCL|nr:predicted protein [Mycena chlorophos]
MSNTKSLPGTYCRRSDSRSAADRADDRIIQAEALACLLYGESGEGFRTLNDEIQDNVCWLLRDLLAEYRVLREQASLEAQ